MLFKEIKTWGTKLGYKIVKKNTDPIEYSWSKLDSDDPTASGVASSVSKVATAIFNHITDNKWLDHQKEYETNKELKKVSLTDYGS